MILSKSARLPGYSGYAIARFIARMIDIWVALLIIYIFIFLLLQNDFLGNKIDSIRTSLTYTARTYVPYTLQVFSGEYTFSAILFTCSIYLWMLIEPFFLHAFGTTFGKSLLKIQLRNHQGNTLSLRGAWRRSIRVWIRGLAMGIPILNIIAMLLAYRAFTIRGITAWDKEDNLILTYGDIGNWRLLGIVILIAVIIHTTPIFLLTIILPFILLFYLSPYILAFFFATR